MKKPLILSSAVCTVLFFGSILPAQAPVVNIDSHRHGNLAAAQGYIVQAFRRLNQAQAANEDQLGGHAQQAKDLLLQADEQIRLAANVANSEGHR